MPLLSHGFRLFFLAATIWAVVAMLLWIGMLAGIWWPPIAFDVVSWHAHALLVGYLGAVLAGFLLTAVPNWTGRLPVRGAPLLILFLLWLAGRIAVLLSLRLPGLAVMAADLAFLAALALFLGREIVAGRTWKNLPVLVLLGSFLAGAAWFHLDHRAGLRPVDGGGFRLMLGMAVMMIALIGGRIVPSFTRNWLVRQGRAERPAPPMQGFDRLALGGLLLAVLLWVFEARGAGVALLFAGVLHLVRLARWHGPLTWREPLLGVLHLAYLFVPLGSFGLGLALLLDTPSGLALHLWTAGGIGLMTLAVMTRASLGHTGRELHAGPATQAIYLALALAVAFRLLAGPLIPPHLAYALSGSLWIAGFAGFVAVYGPILLRPRLRA